MAHCCTTHCSLMAHCSFLLETKIYSICNFYQLIQWAFRVFDNIFNYFPEGFLFLHNIAHAWPAIFTLKKPKLAINYLCDIKLQDSSWVIILLDNDLCHFYARHINGWLPAIHSPTHKFNSCDVHNESFIQLWNFILYRFILQKKSEQTSDKCTTRIFKNSCLLAFVADRHVHIPRTMAATSSILFKTTTGTAGEPHSNYLRTYNTFNIGQWNSAMLRTSIFSMLVGILRQPQGTTAPYWHENVCFLASVQGAEEHAWWGITWANSWLQGQVHLAVYCMSKWCVLNLNLFSFCLSSLMCLLLLT